MANESSPEIGLPPEASNPATQVETPQVESHAASKPGKLDWLMFWKKGTSTPPVQEGPIPGVTPATPDQLFGQAGPKVTTPAEQADLNAQIVKSDQRAA